MGLSPTRPAILCDAPFVLVAAAIAPDDAITTIPIVSWFPSVIGGLVGGMRPFTIIDDDDDISLYVASVYGPQLIEGSGNKTPFVAVQ